MHYSLRVSRIISCDIGHDAVIHHVRYLAHYIVGDRCILTDIDEMHTTHYAKFGNGILKDGEDEKWAYWSKTEHYYKLYKSDGSFTKDSVEDNNGDVNPYGVLPFVFMQNGFRDTGFFDEHTGADLSEVTLDMAVYNTFKNYMIKWQSFKQIVIQGSNIASVKIASQMERNPRAPNLNSKAFSTIKSKTSASNFN